MASSSTSPSFATFSDLVDGRILSALSSLEFTHPTRIQAAFLPPALQGKDVMARSKTGSGKTLAYAIPCVQRILQVRKRFDTSTDPLLYSTRCLILVPTRELAQQVTGHLTDFTNALGDRLISVQNLSVEQPGKRRQQRSVSLVEKPDILVATPSKVVTYLESGSLDLSQLECLVIDEADLVLSLGYSASDIQSLLNGPWSLPANYQRFLVSATLTSDVEDLQGFILRDPVKLILEDEDADNANLLQHAVRCNEEDKFLLLYVLLKLRLIKGKVLVFVNNVDRGYRLKLFLEKFGIKSGVLNSELPFNSRYHSVLEFNRGVFDYLIATDEANDDADQAIPEESTLISTQPESADASGPSAAKSLKRKRGRARLEPSEYGVSRGIDFVDVACVLNFDLPATSKAYTHRIGRTARAGRSGMSLSFVVPKAEWGKHKQGDISLPSAKNDERFWRKIEKDQQAKGGIKEYQFDMAQVNAFRYRMEDGLRSVTKASVREARIKEIKHEVVNSERLKAHFEENPKDLAFLKHDRPLHASRIQPHMKQVPAYLAPRFAPKPKNEPSPEKQEAKASFKKRQPARGAGKGKRNDPLKKFSFGKK